MVLDSIIDHPLCTAKKRATRVKNRVNSISYAYLQGLLRRDISRKNASAESVTWPTFPLLTNNHPPSLDCSSTGIAGDGLQECKER